MAKVILGIGFSKVGAFRFIAEISSPVGVVFLQNLVSTSATLPFYCHKKGSAYSNRCTQKNVTMAKMKVDKQIMMKKRELLLHSHYRNKSELSEGGD